MRGRRSYRGKIIAGFSGVALAVLSVFVFTTFVNEPILDRSAARAVNSNLGDGSHLVGMPGDLNATLNRGLLDPTRTLLRAPADGNRKPAKSVELDLNASNGAVSIGTASIGGVPVQFTEPAVRGKP